MSNVAGEQFTIVIQPTFPAPLLRVPYEFEIVTARGYLQCNKVIAYRVQMRREIYDWCRTTLKASPIISPRDFRVKLGDESFQNPVSLTFADLVDATHFKLRWFG